MFKEAKPIWIESKKKDYNRLCGFLLKFHKSEQSDYELNVAAADCYQCYLNGAFLLAGPARSAKDTFRADTLSIGEKLRDGENILVFLVASYKVNSFQYVENDAFLQAEVLCGGKPLTCTDKYTLAFDIPEHMQKTPRYSFQRAFTEVWKLDAGYPEMLAGERVANAREVILQEEKKILPRASRIPAFSELVPTVVGSGSMLSAQAYENSEVLNGPQFLQPTKIFKTFAGNKLECDLYEEMRGLKTVSFDYEVNGGALEEGLFQLFDFSLDACGFLSLEVVAEKDSVFYVLFDEILRDSDVDPFRLNCLNCVKYVCEQGTYRTLTLEPYTLRYAKIFCAAGRIRVERFCLKEVANPAVKGAKFSFADEKLEKIYRAALNTFAYNCVDIFMDCPSRERAGWLCDGYFTGRVEHLLTGENRTEHDFLENFLLPKKFERLPKGMLPMCYPSDHPDGNFIPTWAMWFVLELDRYASESGDLGMVERARHKIYALLEYFSAFENEFGLLEDLEGWVFIEWSKAAEFTNGVNFCVNMLYALTLETVGKLYRDEAALQRAARMREKIRELSFDGQFFTDHAVRKEGVLTPAKDTTEVCQYYAFFTETATPERYPALWQTLLSDFGPDRKKTGRYPLVWPANAFIGNYLRLSLLERYGCGEQLISEIRGYFTYMADKTMTLWENDTDAASCNHGFASYVLCWLETLNQTKKKGV